MAGFVFRCPHEVCKRHSSVQCLAMMRLARWVGLLILVGPFAESIIVSPLGSPEELSCRSLGALGAGEGCFEPSWEHSGWWNGSVWGEPLHTSG